MEKKNVSIILWPEEQGKAWRLFSQPAKILSASSPDEVPGVLNAAQQAADDGQYAAGFLCYEAAPGLDKACRTHSATNMPLAWFALFNDFQELDACTGADPSAFTASEWQPSMTVSAYTEAIDRIKSYLKSGDTYQVNYTMRLAASLSGDTRALFWHLYRMQRAKYCALIDTDGFTICSASPELFFSLDGNTLTSRPMKGTSSRGLTSEQDEALANALHESQKNRAENVMIVDMVRNDMGRIADPGSVHVPHLFDIERYPTVLQMTSTVECTTSASFPDIMTVLFPCASITGAPKIRTMQLIKELEPTPRSVYTGCIGCLSPGRKAAFNVAIRTITVDKTEGSAEYGVGGGIVWDSDAKTEYEECQVKASVLTAQQPEFELLETILWNPGDGYHLLERHMNRLESSAKYFDYPIDLQRIKTDLVTAGEAMPTVPQKVRLLLDKHGAIRIEVTPLPASQRSSPFQIGLSSQPIDSQDRFLYHKTTNRAIYEQARKEKPDCDDVLLWNERGEITESTIANVVVEKDSQLVTPPVECGLLPGVFRAHLLSCGEIKEQVITKEDVRSTSKFFIINSVRQWIPAQLA